MKKFLITVCLLGWTVCVVNAKTTTPVVQVEDLQAEYQVNPIGIDYAPQLSWKLSSSAAATRQTAYRILVANSEAMLSDDRSDVWDSG